MLLRPSLSATLALDALARDMLGRHFDDAELEATEATLTKGALQVHDGKLLGKRLANPSGVRVMPLRS